MVFYSVLLLLILLEKIQFIFSTAASVVAGDFNPLDTDREVLLSLKKFLEVRNQVNRGYYSEWTEDSPSSPCDWTGILCTTTAADSPRVTAVDLSGNNISSILFWNFSALTELTHLDLSRNTINGKIPPDLGGCTKLLFLNLSHNILDGEVNLTGLTNLQILDLSNNRFDGDIQSIVPLTCTSLVVLNVSMNNFSGSIDSCFDQCYKLGFLDLSTNNLSGKIWLGFDRLREFSVSENYLDGSISPSSFTSSCSLETLDLSQNSISGLVPTEISNCQQLRILNLWGNRFGGKIPPGIGSIPTLEALFLGNNSFDRDIPESLLNLTNLKFLDLSRNRFNGDIQEIFGKFTTVKYLVLHGNSFTGGIVSSGILGLENLVRLDLSFNNFSGKLPIEISRMTSVKFLILAYNKFNGTIPSEFGNIRNLQALDLSFNDLTGTIPASLGNLTSLLWLMLANNNLEGEIPPEIGNCSSLLWLNLANNRLTGNFPPELANIGRNPSPTFESNWEDNDRVVAGSGECLAMKRWIPADYPPFSFVYTLLTRKTCRNIWDRLLKGVGLFPLCSGDNGVNQTYKISGYLQLSGNRLSGSMPEEIEKMHNFTMIHLGQNNFVGELPAGIGNLPLVVLNVSENNFSGKIPRDFGDLKCLQNLDLSYNNFSGQFPTSLNNLTNLSKFNVSYNPFITGSIPTTGQLATFEKESFLGDPLLILPAYINRTLPTTDPRLNGPRQRPSVQSTVLLTLILVFLLCGIFSLIVCALTERPRRLDITKCYEESSGKYSSTTSEISPVMIQLVKQVFTYTDILKATLNFSDEKIIGKGGSGTVYRGRLPDGREVAVKKLQREGVEGEKEFQTEMEVLCGNSFDWPHPNLVPLYGWCLYRSEKILVYKFMAGGSLEDSISDKLGFMWRQRLGVAVDVARALVFLHHECYPSIVHRDVKASNVLLDDSGRAFVTDFGLARMVDVGFSHVSTVVAGTVGYVAPEYGQTWRATTKGDVYSFGVLAMELATGRRALEGGEECLLEWVRRVYSPGRSAVVGPGLVEDVEQMFELLRIGIRCTADSPQERPNMKEVLGMLIGVANNWRDQIQSCNSSPSSK